MHQTDGTIVIRTIHGRKGSFAVGTVTLDLGEFVVKDKRLEQFDDGEYEGSFTISREATTETEPVEHPPTDSSGSTSPFEVIHSYTRAQAIEDGYLVDVSETSEAQEAGFKWPVAMTRTVWDDCVEWSDKDSRRQTPQDEKGRLWDLLYMASLRIRSQGENSGTELFYQIHRVPRGGRGRLPRTVTLKMVFGPGDDGESVITIMMPDED